MMAAELGQQTVEFSALVRKAAEDSFLALKDLVDRSKSVNQVDSDKKIDLLKYLLKTRQRMLRLHVLAKWCQQVPLVQYCQQLATTLSSHDTCFTQAADSLFFMHEGLQQARAPMYDVPSAIEVLLTGGYPRLPKCIEDLGYSVTLSDKQQKPTLRKLDTLLQSKLLEAVLPKEISQVKVSNGMVLLRVDGEFEVLLTLGYRGHLSLWRILHLKLLVGEKNGYVKLEETRRFVLGDDLERRMSVVENPFTILYSVLHEFSIALVMDTVIRQVQLLRLGRWKDAIRFELISDGGPGQGGNVGTMQYGQDGEPDSGNLKTPGVKINYWLDFDKNSGGSDHIACPFLKIEPGPDLQIQCVHNMFLLDPFSDKEAVFSIEQSCIDVEKLLLKAIVCNRHTRLLEINRELCKHAQIFQAAGDVVLEHHGVQTNIDDNEKVCDSGDEYCGDEVLQVRAYGLVYMTLGISIRAGLFILNCSKNIFEQSVLADYEEILNQRSMVASEVFITLRIKSILHLFASMGRFLGLQVYEQGLTMLEIPKFMLTGSDLLLMGFPHCGSSYYLMMQLDKEFKPLFKMLETQPDPAGGLNSVGEGNHIIRINNIDIANMELVEDELNLSLVMREKLFSSPLNDDDDSIQSYGRDLPPDLSSKPSSQRSGCPQPSFSSVVDEVFEFEKGSSATLLSTANKPFNSSPHKYVCSTQGVKIGVGSPKQERGLHYTQITKGEKASCGGYVSGGCLYQTNNVNGLLQNGTFLSSQPLRGSSPAQNIARSKSDQNLSSFRSPSNLGESNYSYGMKDFQARLPIETSNDSPYAIVGSHSSRMHMIPPQLHESQTSATSSKHDQTSTYMISNASGHHTVVKQNKNPGKRTLSDMLSLIPSLNESSCGIHKRRKMNSTASCYPINSRTPISLEAKKKKRCTYGSLLADSNCEVAPNIYLTSLLHVIRHCSLCIKHAQLTSQMDALDIPFVEEVGLQCPSSSLWFRLPFVRDDSWQHICLRLGKSGSMCWDVKVNDPYFKELWELQKGSTDTPWGSRVHIANASDIDSHIRCDPEGVVLTYRTVQFDSIKKLVSDLQRIFNARLFACGMRNLLMVKADEMLEDGIPEDKIKISRKRHGDSNDKMSEQIRRVFKIDAVGLMSLWFCYGPVPVIAHFVVEWESGKNGCTMHVSPDQLWPHTKFLEDFINGAEVASFLDCIRLTAGPLLSLGSAIRPARVPPPVAAILSPSLKQNGIAQGQVMLPNASSNNIIQHASSGSAVSGVGSPLGSHSIHSAAILSSAGRGGPGIVPSSLLPIDVSVVLRGPYWIRIIYRKKFAVDMRCFAGDQVWLQPATPPKGGPADGGSLPCPQFRPFIMEHVAQGLNALETSFTGNLHTGGLLSSSNANATSAVVQAVANGSRASVAGNVGTSRPGSTIVSQGSGGLSRVGNAMLASSSLASMSGLPSRMSPTTGVPVHVKGELNTAFIGLGDDGGYGGGWVPLAALKKVLRGILKYLGVLWLFAQLPELLKDILGSILKENEGALLNLDQEQPALRFFIGGYVFAVSVHRVQLLLQVLSVKRFHHQQQQQQQTQSNTQEELASNEISEICDYFSRRVASEPFDASRVASFITLLTLPISALREFLKLTSWEKGLAQVQSGDVIAPAQRARVELCLENHSGMVLDENAENSSLSKSNIHHNRAQNSVEFSLNFVLDSTLIPHVNAAGGAAWLPHCVSVRLKFSFGENIHVSLVRIDGSHGGKACWSRPDEWDKCKQRIARAVDVGNANPTGDISQGRIKVVAENLQRTLQSFLQQVRDASVTSSASAP